MPQEQEPKYYTVKEAAAILKADPETIRRMCKRGEFKGARKVGDTWRIPRSEVDPQTGKPNTESRAE